MVTIGIPIYNAARFLRDAILSVINQTYSDWTLILLDDGSTDESLSIARSFDDERILLISDGENRGLVSRLNQLIDMCRTKYIVRMDADDIMHPKRLEYQIKIMEENPYIDVLGSNAYSIDEYNNIRGLRFVNNANVEPVKTFIHPSIVVKTEWFRMNKYNPICVRMEDAELWYRSLSRSQFFCVNIPLLYYREFGLNYYKKYLKSIPSCFLTACLYAKEKKYKGACHWLKKMFAEAVKFMIYFVFNIVGKEQLLIDKRFINVEDSIKNNAYLELELSLKNTN